jgi:hypothetical protein
MREQVVCMHMQAIGLASVVVFLFQVRDKGLVHDGGMLEVFLMPRVSVDHGRGYAGGDDRQREERSDQAMAASLHAGSLP